MRKSLSYCWSAPAITLVLAWGCLCFVASLITPASALEQPKRPRPHIVFLITKDSLNYEADKTIPLFAAHLKERWGFRVSVLLGSGSHGAYRFADLNALSKADLVVLFVRRIALPHKQMEALKNYLKKGKPLVGIRTANHAFTVQGGIEPDYEAWPEFVPTILGCVNRGYAPAGSSTQVSVAMPDHTINKGLPMQWLSRGNMYLVKPLLDSSATVLLTGSGNRQEEPVAWTRLAGNSRIFYTSLGYPTDFSSQAFIDLLTHGMLWALGSDEKK